MRECGNDILKIPEDLVGNLHKTAATLPLSKGGLGLRSAVRTSVPAHWASWADVLPMIRDRHPAVATMIVNALENDTASPCLGAASRAAQDLDGVEDFEVPQWRALAAGLRPSGARERVGSTKPPAEREFRRNSVLNRMSGRDRALLRSQSGPVAGVPLSSTASSPLTRIEPALFRVLLQRRLALPLPLSNRTSRCGRPLDAGRRGFALESAAGRVCREAGERVATNQFVRDLDLGVPNANDDRRLEVVADGLPLFGGVQLAVDTTLVSAVRGDGEPVLGAAERDGVALRRARRRKEATYPELTRTGTRARLVVLGMEVGGCWSKEARTFVQMLAKARVRSNPSLLQRRMEQAWTILSRAAASEEDLGRRVARAVRQVEFGELSAGREALEGESVSPGTLRTLRALTDPERRPEVPGEPLLPELAHHIPRAWVVLDSELRTTNLRKARRGAAGAPSGMTAEHLKGLHESEDDSLLLAELANSLAQADVPPDIVRALRLGRITALQKPDDASAHFGKAVFGAGQRSDCSCGWGGGFRPHFTEFDALRSDGHEGRGATFAFCKVVPRRPFHIFLGR